ncbi:unnamed protein product, partial [Allacma fusca]
MIGDELQSIIELDNSEETDQLISMKTPESSEIVQKTKICLEAYGIIDGLVKEFNRYFGPELVSHTLLSMLLISVLSFFEIFYSIQGNVAYAMWVFFYMVMDLWQMYYIAKWCTSMTLSAKTVLSKLYDLDFSGFPASLRCKIKMLALKLSTDPPQICPGHYFTLNKMSVTT